MLGIFFIPQLILLVCTMLVLAGFIRGVRALLGKGGGNRKWRKSIGVLCAIVIAFFAYVPAGPDTCSRVVLDTQYEICVERIFAEMTIQEAKAWLVENGYENGREISLFKFSSYFPRDDRHATLVGSPNPEKRTFNPDAPDMTFQAFRNEGAFRSIPYGTNFHRFFARIGLPPDRFELVVHGNTEKDRIVAVNAWWAFTFL
jgi:hypothetical protein